MTSGLVMVARVTGQVGTDLGPGLLPDGIWAQRPGNARTREAALPCEAQQAPRDISA
jgi:hypothetical protein